MRRGPTCYWLPLATLAAMLATPPASSAQTPRLAPAVELGAGAMFGVRTGGGLTAAGPRVTAHFSPRAAIEAGFDAQLDRSGFRRRDVFHVQGRRTLHQFDGGSIFGTAGLAFQRVTFEQQPEFGFPGFTRHEPQFGPIAGLGVEFAVARYLGIRGDFQFVVTEDSFLRGGLSVSVPIGGYPDRTAWRASRDAVRGGPLEATRLGQRVWATTREGRIVSGDVAGRSAASLTILADGTRTDVAISDIQRLETSDGILDGAAIGTLSGGIPGAVFGGLLGAALCETDDNCALEAGLLIGALGAGLGALAGAIVDSLHVGRRTLYERPGAPAPASLVVVPIVTRRGAGAGGVIRW